MPVFIFAALAVAILCAGCTTPTPTQVTTTPTTAVKTPTTVVTTVPVTTMVSDSALYGTWNLLGGFADNSPRITNNKIYLVIKSDGTLSGNGGCNDYSGSYAINGTTTPYGKAISIGPLATTMKYCADQMTAEQTYLNALQATTSYSIAGDKLTLTMSPGNNLAFQKQS